MTLSVLANTSSLQSQRLDEWSKALDQANVANHGRAKYDQLNGKAREGDHDKIEIGVALASRVWQTPRYTHLKAGARAFMGEAAKSALKKESAAVAEDKVSPNPTKLQQIRLVAVGANIVASYMSDEHFPTDKHQARKFAQDAKEVVARWGDGCPKALKTVVDAQLSRTQKLAPTAGWFSLRTPKPESDVPALPEKLHLEMAYLEADFDFELCT